MSDDLFRLTYLSRSSVPDADLPALLDEVLAVSRANNLRDGVTGALLCNGGFFVQVLEGPFGAVQQTFERIQVDERHSEVVLLHADPVQSRLFGEWAMARAASADPVSATAVISRAMTEPGTVGSKQVLQLFDTLLRGARQDAA